jgi:hypothetical protein
VVLPSITAWLLDAFVSSKMYSPLSAKQPGLGHIHPTRSLVEMVPRQPDVDYEDSITTEQRAALEKESDARQHYELRVDNFGEQSQQ